MTGAMNTMISHGCSDECDAQLLNMDTLPYHMDWKINVMFSYRTGISFGSRCLVTGGSKSETTAWCVVWCIHCPILIQQSVMTWQTLSLMQLKCLTHAVVCTVFWVKKGAKLLPFVARALRVKFILGGSDIKCVTIWKESTHPFSLRLQYQANWTKWKTMTPLARTSCFNSSFVLQQFWCLAQVQPYKNVWIM